MATTSAFSRRSRKHRSRSPQDGPGVVHGPHIKSVIDDKGSSRRQDEGSSWRKNKSSGRRQDRSSKKRPLMGGALQPAQSSDTPSCVSVAGPLVNPPCLENVHPFKTRSTPLGLWPPLSE
eukprot:364493-Chlamydomonas_euryale.AAC.3